ncbi:murein L,D-transpeptidase catalytic domain family protein [bacterium]|nr:murein L,D-transpeptidase catalytic domain family protein [bacterium]
MKISHTLLLLLSLSLIGCANEPASIFKQEGGFIAPGENDYGEDFFVPDEEEFVEVPEESDEDDLSEFDFVDPTGAVPSRAREHALRYFKANQDRFSNKQYITIIDFNKHSGNKRFFVMNMQFGNVSTYYTSHGSGSDPSDTGYAKKFSNTTNSHMSSVGFYRTAETYHGNNGYSLRLDGLSSTNSKARSRAIVVHGASYVNSSRSKMGRSWGCPALDFNYSRDVIGKIKGGSLILAWNG